MPAGCRAGESKCRTIYKEMRSWASSGPRSIRILWLAWQKKESGGYFSVFFHSSLYLRCSRREPERELRKSLHKGKNMDISWNYNTSLLCDFQRHVIRFSTRKDSFKVINLHIHPSNQACNYYHKTQSKTPKGRICTSREPHHQPGETW